MPRPASYEKPEHLLDAVRQQISLDPNISQVELRRLVGGAQSVVSAAMRAVLYETGRRPLKEGEVIDARFANLIRAPEASAPLDLRLAVSATLNKDVKEHLLKTSDVLEDVIARIHTAALSEIDKEHAAAQARVELAERREARAQEFVEGLRCELAEAVADADRARAAAAEENGRLTVEITRLTRDVEDARAAQLRAEQARDGALGERAAAEDALREARGHAMTAGRDLAAAGARIQELERQVADLGARLTRSDGELAAARAAEGDARAKAAAARATVAAHEATIRLLEAAVAARNGRTKGRKERVSGEPRLSEGST